MSEDFQPNPADLSVAIGFPTGPMVPWPTTLSLARTMHACALRGIDATIEYVAGSSIITTARSLVIQRFLKGDKKRLFWIDSDIEWEPDDFLRALGLSAKMDIVCGTYPLKREGQNAFVILHPDPTKITLNPYGCVKIDGTGLGFCVMTREVVEKIASMKSQVFNQGTGEMMPNVFRIDTFNGNLEGEDMAFFRDLRGMGCELWLDPTLELGHVGQKVFRGDVVKALRLEHMFTKGPK